MCNMINRSVIRRGARETRRWQHCGLWRERLWRVRTDGRIILKRVVNESDAKVEIGFGWPRYFEFVIFLGPA